MLPAQEAAASELQDLQDPRVAIGRRLDGERDDAVGDRELGRDRDLVRSVLADPQGRRRVGRQVPREVLEEAPERRRVRGERMQRLEAVDHEQPRSSLSEHRDHATERLGQRVRMAQAGAQVLVEHAAADRVRVEEGQGLSVPQDLLERLGDRREVDRGPVLARVLEQVLLRQDRLAGTGQTHDDVDGVGEQPAAQDGVEPLAPAGDPVRHRAGTTSFRNELVPRRSSHRGDELERLERLLQERGRAGLERRIPRGDAGQRQDGDAAGMDVSAQLEPGAPGDEEVDDRELRPIRARPRRRRRPHRARARPRTPRSSGSTRRTRPRRGRARRAGSRSGCRASASRRSGGCPETPGEHAVRIARRDPLADPVGDEAEALDIQPRVQAVAPGAPNRLHDAVPLLPRAERGRRDPHHPCDGPDAVGGDFGHDRPIIRRFSVPR